MSLTTPIQASAVRKGNIILLKSFPCKIVDISTSKTGKHGHAKVHFVGLDIFTGRKHEDLCPSTHNMEQVITKTQNYQVIDISDDEYLSLIDDAGEMAPELKLPEDQEDEMRKQFFNLYNEENTVIIQILRAMDQEKISHVSLGH